MFKDRSNYEPPPEPGRRAWVHPSELGPVVAPPRRRGRAGTIAAILGVTGAAVAGVVGFIVLGASSTPSTRSRVGGLTQTVGLHEPLNAVVTVDAASGPAPDAPAVRGSGISMGDGTIVTSAALVAQGSTVRVNGTSARVVARDAFTDVAVLHTTLTLDAALLPVEDRTQPGDTLTLTSRSGNALGRVDALDVTATGPDGTLVAGLINTTITANRDGVGSAVTDHSGTVVGFVSGLATPTVLIVPMSTVRDVVEQARRAGYVRHGTLGATVIESAVGPTVQDVTADGPAARAGLQPGDVILGFADRDVVGIGDFVTRVRGTAPGARVTITYERGGRERSVVLAVGSIGG